ncbi:MAG: CZB domain-containing protein [Candidatus Omnitrophota bacterium]
MSKIDFIMVRTFHKNWMIALRLFLKGQGGLTEVQALSHEDCDFGKWLYSEGLSIYGSVFEMRRLEKIHVRLHEEVRELMAAKQSGDEKGQERLMRKIQAASQEILDLMKTIEDNL